MGAVRQKLLQHATQGLHARCVVLVELRLKLAVESADELLSGLLMSQKAISNGYQALVHVGTEVMGAAVEVLL